MAVLRVASSVETTSTSIWIEKQAAIDGGASQSQILTTLTFSTIGVAPTKASQNTSNSLPSSATSTIVPPSTRSTAAPAPAVTSAAPAKAPPSLSISSQPAVTSNIKSNVTSANTWATKGNFATTIIFAPTSASSVQSINTAIPTGLFRTTVVVPASTLPNQATLSTVSSARIINNSQTAVSPARSSLTTPQTSRASQTPNPSTALPPATQQPPRPSPTTLLTSASPPTAATNPPSNQQPATPLAAAIGESQQSPIPSSSTPPPLTASTATKLSVGEEIGIAIGGVFIIATIIALIYFYAAYTKRHAARRAESSLIAEEKARVAKAAQKETGAISRNSWNVMMVLEEKGGTSGGGGGGGPAMERTREPIVQYSQPEEMIRREYPGAASPPPRPRRPSSVDNERLVPEVRPWRREDDIETNFSQSTNWPMSEKQRLPQKNGGQASDGGQRRYI